MAGTTIYDTTFELLEGRDQSELLGKVKRVEKRIFPKGEALDFDMELKKRNTELTIILDEANDNMPVVAYMVHALARGTAFVHKVCVAEEYRRRGIARNMMSQLARKLENQGCQRIQLWVDAARMPARLLYRSQGFHEIGAATDYYGPGRTGIRMVLELGQVG